MDDVQLWLRTHVFYLHSDANLILCSDMRCDVGETFMECAPDPNMQMSAIVTGDGNGQPPPFFCGPKTYFPFTGYYDNGAASIVNDIPFMNRVGRTDVQG